MQQNNVYLKLPNAQIEKIKPATKYDTGVTY